MADKTEIKYGRMNIDGRETGYATWMEDGRKHEVIAPAYQNLIKIVDGKITKPTKMDIILWTRIAGDMGTEELMKHLETE